MRNVSEQVDGLIGDMVESETYAIMSVALWDQIWEGLAGEDYAPIWMWITFQVEDQINSMIASGGDL